MPYKQFNNDLPIPKSLLSPLLIDAIGLPRYWVTVWSVLWTQDLAASTEMHRLRHIETLYAFGENLNEGVHLDDLLGRVCIDELGDLLEAYFISLMNRPKVTESTQKQWHAGISFVKDVVLRFSKSGIGSGKFAEVETRLLHLDVLYGQLRVRKSKHPDILRSYFAHRDRLFRSIVTDF